MFFFSFIFALNHKTGVQMERKRLSAKEKETMDLFWSNGAMTIREALDLCREPKPAYTTLATVIRILTEKDYLDYKQYGNTYHYSPKVTAQEYSEANVQSVVSQFYQNSYRLAVSAFIKEEKLSVDDLKEIIAEIENNRV